MSLKYRIALTIFLLEIIMMVVVLSHTLSLSEQLTRSQLSFNENTMLKLMADLSNSALFSMELSELQTRVDLLAENQRIAHIMVADERGLVVVSTDFSTVGNPMPQDFQGVGNLYWRTRELRDFSGRRGHIAIQFNNSYLQSSITEIQQTGFVLALIGMALIAVAGIISGFMLTRRMETVTKVAEELTHGNYDVVADVSGKDEISVMAKAFNDMAYHIRRHVQELENSRSELKHARDEMEVRIKERTLELAIELEERKRAEELLSRAKEEAEQANRSKSIFLANMSHEIRTPMNAILGFSQVIQSDSDLSSKQRKHVNAIRRAGDHLMGIINDILDISKIEAGAMTTVEEDFDIIEMVEGISQMFSMRCREKKISWVMEGVNLPYRWVVGDQGKIRQILFNLIGNAIKFTNKGLVRFSLVFNNGEYIFQVQDTGPGIEKDMLDSIFEPFQQAKEGLSEGGTGLGLTISKKEAELMGGELMVDSQVGRGTIFTLSLPLRKANSQHKELPENPLGNYRLKPGQEIRALVVDDVSNNREVLCYALENAGVLHFEAQNGEQALDMVPIVRPDIIFMDIRMPVMDGIEALGHIQREYADQNIKIVATTASSLSVTRQEYIDKGFHEYVGKPFRFKQVYRVIEELLGAEFEDEMEVAQETEPCNNYLIDKGVLQQLMEAAENNLITEIKGQVNHQSDSFAEKVMQYVTDYDMEGLIKFLRQVENERCA